MINEKTILVIDDDIGIQEAIKAVLEFGEFKVIVAANEKEAMKAARVNKPDLILLDLLLSGKDGVEIAKALKNMEETSKTPIIMLSAHPDAHKASREGGTDDFIAKPFDMMLLLEKVNKHLNIS